MTITHEIITYNEIIWVNTLLILLISHFYHTRIHEYTIYATDVYLELNDNYF